MKFHLDGSEVSWLVYADWLDDQDKNGDFIRKTIDDGSNQWHLEYTRANSALRNHPGVDDMNNGSVNCTENSVGSVSSHPIPGTYSWTFGVGGITDTKKAGSF